MAKTTWQFELDGQPHALAMQHGWWSSKRVIMLDGRVVVAKSKRLMLDTGSTDIFEVGEGHQAVARVVATWWSLGLVFQHRLQIDGRRVEPVP